MNEFNFIYNIYNEKKRKNILKLDKRKILSLSFSWHFIIILFNSHYHLKQQDKKRKSALDR